MKILFIMSLIASSGCVAKSSHVDQLSRQTARLAVVVRQSTAEASRAKPESVPLAIIADDASEAADDLKATAKQGSSAIPPTGDIMSLVLKGLTGDYAGLLAGGAAMLGGGGLAMRERKKVGKMKSKARALAGMSPEEAKRRMKKDIDFKV